MTIEFKVNEPLATEDIIAVFDSSGITRPTHDPARIRRMFDHANLVVSAWHDGELVGLARTLTDFSYCAYLSDLAVRREYQHQKIGRQLIEITRQEVGEQAMLLLLSAAPAMGYYPKVGFERVENGFIIPRKA